MINYVTGDATAPVGDGPKVIVHVCNDIGIWGRGFVMAVSARWPHVRRRYVNWHISLQTDEDESVFMLGAVQFVPAGGDLWVANMIGQHRTGMSLGDGRPPVRYEAIGDCLARVAEFAARNGCSVHMPRIGCGLAGGVWSRIEPIIREKLVSEGVEVTVYDLTKRKGG